MRLPRVAEALAPFGYSHEVIDEGWRLMRAITDVQVTRSEAAGETAPAFASSSELEEFASLWFPLARAALGRRFAAQERRLFHGLFEARGQRAAVSVLVFSERLEAMALGKAPFLNEGPLAWAVLNQHGLDESVRDKGLSLGRQIESPLPDTSDDRVQREEEASEALWSWTLRWSGIARASIKNKTLLHALGLSPERRPSAATVEPIASVEEPPRPCVRVLSENSTMQGRILTTPEQKDRNENHGQQ